MGAVLGNKANSSVAVSKQHEVLPKHADAQWVSRAKELSASSSQM
jgi:hypothetical protein